jgi:Mg-chelatase subunit ChlD
MFVTVSDKSGPVMNLNRGSFQLESKSLALRVITAAPRNRPPRAMLVVDISGSMRGLGKSEVVAALARGIIDAAPPNAPLALVTFNEQIRDRFDFSASKEILIQKLEAISREAVPSKGVRTALLDALTEAAEMFGVPQPADVVFLISDGGDNRSRTRASVLRRSLLERGLRVYSFAPSELMLPTEEERLGLEELLNLSRDTGGRPMPLENSSFSGHWNNFPKALALSAEMGRYTYVLAASTYELEIDMDRPIERPVTLKLKIIASDGKELRNLQPLYPHELMPCAHPN